MKQYTFTEEELEGLAGGSCILIGMHYAMSSLTSDEETRKKILAEMPGKLAEFIKSYNGGRNG